MGTALGEVLVGGSPPGWTRRGSPYTRFVPDKRQTVIGEINDLIEANKELRRRLVASEAVLRRGVRRLEQGADLTSTLMSARPAERRRGINDALRALETVRHNFRIAVTAAALEEGMNLSDIGRVFGISRQLVQRYAQEAKGSA